LKDQDPAAFDGAIIESSKAALNIRYTLLPYLYTLLATHSMQGNTVARALWHEFPTDPETAGIDRQFLWGSGFLISPVLKENQTVVNAYFPDSRFFDYYTGEEVKVRKNYTNLSAPLDFIPLHVHGGNVLPTQEPAVNTELARQNPLGLIVALDDNQQARGSFYYDAGVNYGNLIS
jgi:maltase-glucoamylase